MKTRGLGFIGVRNLRSQGINVKFSADEGAGLAGGGQSLSLRGRLGTQAPERSQAGMGVARDQASLGRGSPASDGAGVTESPDLGGAGSPCTHLVPLMNWLPRRRVSTTVGGSSCSAWTPGLAPGARCRGGSGTRGAPTWGPDGAAVPSARSPARPAPASAASAPARQPSVPDRPDRRGPAGAGRGRGRSGDRPPTASGRPASRRLPLAAGAATAARGGMGPRALLD